LRFRDDRARGGHGRHRQHAARIEKLGGHFEISSPAGGGTLVRFDVPMEYQS
jgi:signal transduction histidine kinase